MGFLVLIVAVFVFILIRKEIILGQIKQEIIDLYTFKPDQMVHAQKLYKYYKSYAHRLEVEETHFPSGTKGLYFEQTLKESGDKITITVMLNHNSKAVISVYSTKAAYSGVIGQ